MLAHLDSDNMNRIIARSQSNACSSDALAQIQLKLHTITQIQPHEKTCSCIIYTHEAIAAREQE
jgi:hypothetical protein